MRLPMLILLVLTLVSLSTQEPQDTTTKPEVTISPNFFWWWFPPYYPSSACSGIRQCQYVAENRICAYDTIRGWRSFRNLCTLNEYNRCYGYNFVQSSLGYCLVAG